MFLMRKLFWSCVLCIIVFYLFADVIIFSLAMIPGARIDVLRNLPDIMPEWLIPLSDEPCLSVIVLKTGRSGSTWLYNTLNKIPHTRVMEELHVNPLFGTEPEDFLSNKARCHRGIRMQGFTSDIQVNNALTTLMPQLALVTLW